MAIHLTTLPQGVLRHLCTHLAPLDILHLATTCKSLAPLATDQVVWKEKYESLCLHSPAIERLLNCAGLHFMETEMSEMDYRSMYVSRLSLARRETPRDEAEGEEGVPKSATTFAHGVELIQQYQQCGALDLLQRASEAILETLDEFPEHPGCFHMLGMICFLRNAFTPALKLLHMGEALDPSYEGIDELIREITQVLESASKDDGTPLMEEGPGGKEPAPVFINALTRIFGQFDQDRDTAWSEVELSSYVRATNGANPPPGFCQQMARNFGATDQGHLSFDGFIAFYVAQSLDEPLETRADLEKLGFDRRSLAALN